MIVHGGEVTQGSTSSVSMTVFALDRNKETHLLYLAKANSSFGQTPLQSPMRSYFWATYH